MKNVYDYLDSYGINTTPDSGQEIKRAKGIYTHTGIVIGRRKYDNVPMVFHNHPNSGPSIVTLNEFEAGYRASYTNKPSDNWQTVLLRSFRQVESNNYYRLMDYNCQDASNISRTGRAASHGRDATVTGLLGLALLLLLAGGSQR